MNPERVRPIQMISALAAVSALLLTSTLVLFLAPRFGTHFEEFLGGTRLPGLTTVVLEFAPQAPVFAVVASVLYLAGAFLLLRSAPSPDAGSTRLLLLNTLAWVLCFRVHGAVFMALGMPIVRIAVRMQQP